MRGGMPNMQKLMKQAQQMQKEMETARKEINETEFVGKSASDLVVATFTGDNKLKDLQIKADVIDPEDPDMLQDLIVDAVNHGLVQISEATEQKMGKYTKGLM